MEEITETNLFDVITLLRAMRWFGSTCVTVNHDVLGKTPDHVTIRETENPNIVFYARVEELKEDTFLQGGQMSFVTFRMIPTGTTFQMTPEILKWITKVARTIKASSSRFTAQVH